MEADSDQPLHIFSFVVPIVVTALSWFMNPHKPIATILETNPYVISSSFLITPIFSHNSCNEHLSSLLFSLQVFVTMLRMIFSSWLFPSVQSSLLFAMTSIYPQSLQFLALPYTSLLITLLNISDAGIFFSFVCKHKPMVNTIFHTSSFVYDRTTLSQPPAISFFPAIPAVLGSTFNIVRTSFNFDDFFFFSFLYSLLIIYLSNPLFFLFIRFS